MAIDMSREQLLTLREAADILPRQRGGKKVHVSTLYRWASPSGVRGVRLETLKLGGTVVTSVEALQSFAEACSRRDSRPATQASRRREHAIREAEQELDDAGL